MENNIWNSDHCLYCVLTDPLPWWVIFQKLEKLNMVLNLKAHLVLGEGTVSVTLSLRRKVSWVWNFKNKISGNSLVVQWLGLCTFTAEDPGSIPGQGTKRKEGGNKDNYKKGGGCEKPDVPEQKMGAEPSQSLEQPRVSLFCENFSIIWCCMMWTAATVLRLLSGESLHTEPKQLWLGIVGCAEALEEVISCISLYLFWKRFLCKCIRGTSCFRSCVLNIGSIWALVSQIWPHQEVSINSFNCELQFYIRNTWLWCRQMMQLCNISLHHAVGLSRILNLRTLWWNRWKEGFNNPLSSLRN